MMKYVSMYQFAREKGVREQYIYGKYSAGKIPKNCLVTTPGATSNHVMLIRDKAEEWWLALLAAREAKIVKAASAKKRKPIKDPTPERVIANVIQLTDSTTDPYVVEDLMKILEQLSKETK